MEDFGYECDTELVRQMRDIADQIAGLAQELSRYSPNSRSPRAFEIRNRIEVLHTAQNALSRT